MSASSIRSQLPAAPPSPGTEPVAAVTAAQRDSPSALPGSSTLPRGSKDTLREVTNTRASKCGSTTRLGITESFRLENIIKLIEPNHQPSTAKATTTKARKLPMPLQQAAILLGTKPFQGTSPDLWNHLHSLSHPRARVLQGFLRGNSKLPVLLQSRWSISTPCPSI